MTLRGRVVLVVQLITRGQELSQRLRDITGPVPTSEVLLSRGSEVLSWCPLLIITLGCSCLLAAVPADEPASQPLMKEPVGSLYQSAIKDRTATHTDHTNEARVVS